MNVKSQYDQIVTGQLLRGCGFTMVLAGSFLFSAPAIASGTSFWVLVPERQTVPEQAATGMLIEEASRRSPMGVHAELMHGSLSSPGRREIVILARWDAVPPLLPPSLAAHWLARAKTYGRDRHPEGFSIVSLLWQGERVTVIAGNDARGELFGAGYLLRQMDCPVAHKRQSQACSPTIPANLNLASAPDKPIRGHQIGYRNKNNTYDAWTLPQFEQQIRDLAIFGTNSIQLIAPVSDDDSGSVLFPAPPLETVIGISGLLQKYGLDCDLYYPELRDYAQPEAVDAELKDFEALVKAMPEVSSLHIPGGDPGHNAPEVLFPVVAREAEILHRYHPGAPIWISAQGFDQERYASFYRLLDEQLVWLTGVFFGPQSRNSFETQRKRIPARYAMQFYPDIAHTTHAQFPVPEWDPIWALTEGREPICPRPEAFSAIYRHYARLHSGFYTYSEGVNDDINKIVFTELGWSASTPVDRILTEYARYFLGRHGSQLQATVAAIRGLEADWNGPIVANRSIARTYASLKALERDSDAAQVVPKTIDGNGRWESLLYRATYDDYVQRKLIRERGAERAALTSLRDGRLDAGARVAEARGALDGTHPSPAEKGEHDRLFALAAELFRDWGLQLSVPLFHAENWERGANLDRVDTPLTDSAWLREAMAGALRQADEPARLAALRQIADWRHPVPDAIYDDLGDPANEPHLVRGPSWQEDPEIYHAAIDGIADRTLASNPSPENLSMPSKEQPWRLSWLDYAETLYETPLTLRYTGLDPHRRYTVRVTYAGEDYALPLRLVANGTTEVHGARLRRTNPETVDFAVPIKPSARGTLSLQWTGPAGSGGSGRGRQIAEVWLLPESSKSKQ